MSEVSISDRTQQDPIVVSQYDSGPGSMFEEWQTHEARDFELFYEKTYWLSNQLEPSIVELRATQPSPDSVYVDFISFEYRSEPFYAPMDFESAPAINHETLLQVIAALWTKGTLIDPGNPPQECPPSGGAATGCAPLADLEMVKKGLEEKKIKLYKDERGFPLQVGEVCKKTMVLGNKNDLENSRDNWEIIKELYSSSFLLYSISAEKKLGLEELKRETFEKLEILRVYTKSPGKPLDYSDPVILKKGQKVLDAAFIIHKDFAHNLKYARIWGKGKYEGQMVHRDEHLTDGDVIEFHI